MDICYSDEERKAEIGKSMQRFSDEDMKTVSETFTEEPAPNDSSRSDR
jgi:hypothetical protein